MGRSTDTSVLVLGGGPGGSTAAALLARRGLDVILLEKEEFPRYHIGESLLPSCLRVLDELGVRDRVEDYGFQRKEGSLFDWSGEIWDFEFGTREAPLHAFQVVRSEFDQLLLENAAEMGVDVRQNSEATRIEFSEGRPTKVHFLDDNREESSCSFRYLVDASGRAGLMATRYLRNRNFHEVFRNVALWRYWRRTGRLADAPVGATASCAIPHGWVWAIPLHDDSLSLGVVMHKDRLKTLRESRGLEDIYLEAVESSRVVKDLIACGEPVGDLRAETDYSYAAEDFSGPGYYLVGDAACFLDPLLSTGVHLATFSGLLAAASIVSASLDGVSETDAYEFFGASYRRAYLRMLVIVSAFYQMNSGRDAYFEKARELTLDDDEKQGVAAAFVNVVSGVEDLRDLGQASSTDLLDSLMSLYAEHYKFIRTWRRGESQPLGEVKQGIERMRLVASAQDEFSLSPDTAVNGYYVEGGSTLGLRQASSPVDQ